MAGFGEVKSMRQGMRESVDVSLVVSRLVGLMATLIYKISNLGNVIVQEMV